MIKKCLSLFRQGWLGVPIFFVGLVSLAFSQFSVDEDATPKSPDELSQFIGTSLTELKERIGRLATQSSANAFEAKYKSVDRKLVSLPDQSEQSRISSNLQAVADAWKLRSGDVTKGISSVEGRLLEAQKIYQDLENDFAGRMEEATPSLSVLQENIQRSTDEIIALEQLSSNAIRDAQTGYNMLIREVDATRVAPAPPSVPVVTAPAPPVPVTETGKNLASVIQANEAVSLTGESIGSSIQSNAGEVRPSSQAPSNPSDDMIRRLRAELADSKNMGTELSTDTANLQSDLRKAYREIVSLQTNLRESEMMVSELETTKNSLWNTSDGRLPNADTVSRQITQLQSDLEGTRNDLRQSRQSLLLEQERSNSMIRSVTSELERTRRELDNARVAAVSSGADSGRLLLLERELTQTKRALQMARNIPQDSSSETYLNLQDELRKAMGEIARMQVDLGEKEDLERELLQLRSTLEEVGDSPSRSASPAYVNKLLIDLNAAKKEVAKARASNQQERRELAERVISLENELLDSQVELENTKIELAKTQESMATREFEFATTIKRLEEDAQLAQEAISKAALGQLPAIPFVDEMEKNLANSEARMQSLASRFDTEQSRATEVIDGLQMELDAALIRQKQAINELNIREKNLVGKDKEIAQLRQEKKKLNEELDVVKVISGQLNDLNEVLDQTKETQSNQTGSMDMVVASLRDELNKAKVELVFAFEERDNLKQESSLAIINLEQQLEDTQTQLLIEEENLVLQARDSKDLLLELKSELDAAREEIARMKTAGLGESVETRQAVSQLQEALGTIRILQESLDEAESVNLEVDNLRSELANAMSTQLNELQRSEDEKLNLQNKVKDLDAEIAIIREQGVGSSLSQKNLIADLQEKLRSSEALTLDLEQRLNDSEDTGISSLVSLENELSNSRGMNQELRDELASIQKVKGKTVELLEKELANAMNQLDELENNDPDASVDALRKENQLLLKRLLAKDESYPSALELGEDQVDTIEMLESKLGRALNELARIETNAEARKAVVGASMDNESILRLEDELATAEATIVELQTELSNKKGNDRNDEADTMALLERKLGRALGELERIEKNGQAGMENDGLALDNKSIIRLEDELAKADETISALQNKLATQSEKTAQLFEDLTLASEKINEMEKLYQVGQQELNNAVEEITNKEAELELTKAMQGSVGTPSVEVSEDIVMVLQNEINLLKSELDDLKVENEDAASSNSPSMIALQSQLQDAVAESMEAQMELEETKQKLAQMEQMPTGSITDDEIRTFIEDAKESEKEAEQRITELTSALQNSESLRKEVEELLKESLGSSSNDGTVEGNPPMLDLQNELVLLQQDLLNARNLEDPRVRELEIELRKSQEDGTRLNLDFKNAMQDFSRLKEQLEILEAENSKLNEISLVQARNQAGQANSQLQVELNKSLRDISNLKNQLVDREQRLNVLTEQLALAETTRPGIAPDNSALRAQIIRLQGFAKSAADRENQAKLDVQRSNGDLAVAESRIASLEESLRQSQSLSRGLPSRMPPISSGGTQTPQLSPLQIAELASLREQNQRLQEQFRNLANAPGRDGLDRRIQDLNQKNLTAQIQLDQERSRVQDLRKQLADARGIKQEIIERGQSANLKVNLLNDELEDARGKIGSLEKALIAAREAIRVLQRGGTTNSTIQVSIPSASSSLNSSRSSSTNSVQPSYSRPASRSVSPFQPSYNQTRRSSTFQPTAANPRYNPANRASLNVPVVQNVPSGQSTMQLKAEVQFLNNKKRPAGFTEFFLVRESFDSIMENARIRIPTNEGINSYAEFWARAVQRGYRYPGVAASIRNALARTSLTRLKTNSMGVANVEKLESGKYFVIGASSLGQVGIVWSKAVSLQQGENQVKLDLRDAAWAQ